MHTIVVGYDGSGHAHRALDRAAELCTEHTHLVVVSATPLLVDPRPSLVPYGVTRLEFEEEPGGQGEHVEQDLRERDRVLAEAKELLSDHLGTATFVEAHGDPAFAITESAREHDADLIVVGTRGRNMLERFLLGSVSSKVAHHAPCDVLIVR